MCSGQERTDKVKIQQELIIAINSIISEYEPLLQDKGYRAVLSELRICRGNITTDDYTAEVVVAIHRTKEDRMKGIFVEDSDFFIFEQGVAITRNDLISNIKGYFDIILNE